ELAPVFVIVLLGNQVLSANIPLISYHKMIETESGEHLSQDISYIVVELKKFTKREDELASHLDYWLYFLFCWDVAKNPPKTLKEATILEAYEQLERYRWSEEEYQLYFNAKALAEQEAENLEMKYTKGFEKGRAEGKAEEMKTRSLEIAKNMLLNLHLGIDVVQKATGLSTEELKKLPLSTEA
ncbi:MAG: Rpn family recombination-promoting nuclease/putative transposase, partial [Cytophagales bacterium]|nr:Rpn family recombination-promoting nuclease/putative transposase [Cytophagales bacterium]